MSQNLPSTDNRPIAIALRLVKKKGWNQSEFARRMDVLPQDITNWKRRGMPPDKHKLAAEVLSCSIDGRSVLGVLGDFGIGNAMEYRDAMASAEKRDQN